MSANKKLNRICALIMALLILFVYTLASGIETVYAAANPGQVTSLELTVTGQPKAVLEWDEATGEANGYTIMRDDKAIVRVNGKSVTSYVDESLEPGKSYSYAVVPHYKDDSGNVTLGDPSPSEKILNGYTYRKESNGTATLTGFTGRGDTTTPANIDGVNITRIGESCFRGNVWLEEVIVSDGVVSIDDYAFEACSMMSKATLPDSITTIGEGAFNGCMQMKNCEIPAGITEIGRGAFLYCGKLTKVNLPENLESIGRFAFAGCENLTDVTFKGNGLTEIPDRAFYKCINLRAIVLPDSIESIGKRAFSGCEKLENCDYPDTTSLGEYVFENTPLDQAGGGDTLNDSSNTKSSTSSNEIGGDASPKTVESKSYRFESSAGGGIFNESKFRGYKSIQDRYAIWVQNYYGFNRNNFPAKPNAMPYTYMYTGEDHYRQMVSALNGDDYKTQQSIIRSGDDYREMYLMIDHGLFAELSRGRMPEDLLLYSGITPERVYAFAGRDEKASGAITDELRGQIIDRIGEVYEEPAMMSTTGSMRVAFNYSSGDYGSKTVVMIYASKEAMNELGSIGIDRIGDYKGEQEILLNANARHRILDVGTVREIFSEIDPVTKEIISSREGESRTYIKIELLGGQEGSPEILTEPSNPGGGGNTIEDPANPGGGGSTGTGVEPAKKKSIASASVKSVVYNGKVRKPVVTCGGKTLREGVDYTAKWSKASFKDVGIYTGTITGIGAYTGKATLKYRIIPKGTNIKKLKKGKGSITITWNKQPAKMSGKRITGYQIQLASDKNFKKNLKTATIKSYKTAKKKVSGLKKGRKYYVRIRTYRTINGTKLYSNWSGVKAIKTA